MPEAKTILVVDDDDISLKTLEKLLTSFGYSAITASDGPDALTKLTQDVQMVLLDVMMPDMNGCEVARRIRRHPEYGNVPIIMVTSLTKKEDRLAAAHAGANDFVSKPLDALELRIRIAAHLKLKEAQDKRRESDARYRLLVENSPVGIVFCNLRGEISEINAAAASLFGIPFNEQGCSRNVFEDPELTCLGFSDLLRACIESGELIVKETAFGAQREKPVRLYVVPVREKGDSVSGFQILAEGISDRKRVEELTSRRTRLKAFAEMARGSVGHFSETLQNIDEQVAAGLKAVDAEAYLDIRPSLEKARISVRRASETLSLLKKFAQGYAKRDRPRTAFNFSDMVREALEVSKPSWNVQPSMKAVEINLECNFVEECFVEGERTDLVEAVANLISNAVEAMPRGGNLRVKTYSDAGQVGLDVQDDGVGMTEEQLKSIGTPFRTSKKSHAGLGLAVSLGIIRWHRGSCSISSKKSLGTIVTVKFPLTERQQEERDDHTLMIPGSNPKILFVDPDDIISSKFVGEFQGKGPMY